MEKHGSGRPDSGLTWVRIPDGQFRLITLTTTTELGHEIFSETLRVCV